MAPKQDYDVAVIGAGPAGVAAACAAGMHSGRVLLVDAASRLGGSVTAAMHRSLCGLYSAEPKDAQDTLNDGMQRRVVERMLRLAPGEVRPRRYGKVWVLEFPAAAWEPALGECCVESNVDVRLDSPIVGVEREPNRILGIRLRSASSKWISVGSLVDCSGAGAALHLVGEDALLPVEAGSGRMLGGYSIRFSGLGGDLESLRLKVPYTLMKASMEQRLPKAATFTVFYPAPTPGEGICKLAIDPADFSEGKAQRCAEEILGVLLTEVEEFWGAAVVERSPRALPRDGRRLRGKTIVGEEDVLSARRFGQNAVRAWWPIERWDVLQGPTYAYPPTNEHYQIPTDALRSERIENLFAAGNCVSSSTAASASIRASGICLATGDAAGLLARGTCEGSGC